MALWADCQNLTASDLVPYDGLLSSVVSTEGIDVESKSQVAHELISSTLIAHFPLQSGIPVAQPCERIVVTAPLRRWHALLTLEGVYREAYFRHLSERYKSRADYLMLKASEAMETVLLTGLGICERPIRRAPQPELTPTGGSLTAGVWHVAATLTESEEEGEGSEIASIILMADGGISVRLTGPLAMGQSVHVYAGSSPDRLYRQTTVPAAADNAIVLAQTSTSGPLIGWGQTPNRFLSTDRRIQRG